MNTFKIGPTYTQRSDSMYFDSASQDWFIARHIRDLDDHHPRIAEANQWAAIVGAIADRLDSGRSLPPDADVIAALRDMQRGLLEVAK